LILVLGSESDGVSSTIKRFATHNMVIPPLLIEK